MRERGGGERERESNSLLTLPVGKSPIPFFIQECFHACVAGCGYKVSFLSSVKAMVAILFGFTFTTDLLMCILQFEIDTEEVDKVRPNRPPPPPPVAKPPPHVVRPGELTQDLPGTSA